MEEPVEKKKSKKWLVVIMIIILLAIAFIGGQYLIENNVLNLFDYIKKEKVESNDSKVKETKYEEITLEEAVEFVNGNCNASYFISQQPETMNVVEGIQKLDNDYKLEQVYYCNQESFGDTVTKDQMEELFLKTFGSKAAAENGDIKCFFGDYTMYYYNVKKEIYTKNEDEHLGHGGDGRVDVINHSVNFNNVNNKYELLIKRAYIQVADLGSGDNLYTNYADAITSKKENAIISYSEILPNGNDIPDFLNWKDYFDKNHDKLKDKLWTYKYTLAKENGIIKLLSYKVIK